MVGRPTALEPGSLGLSRLARAISHSALASQELSTALLREKPSEGEARGGGTVVRSREDRVRLVAGRR